MKIERIWFSQNTTYMQENSFKSQHNQAPV